MMRKVTIDDLPSGKLQFCTNHSFFELACGKRMNKNHKTIANNSPMEAREQQRPSMDSKTMKDPLLTLSNNEAECAD